MAKLKLKGEDRADYFYILCADCGEHVDIKVSRHGTVPGIEAECRKCKGTTFQKLMAPFWTGWPTHP
jgi:predicted SprT family Zn-dependent metalloprotease